MGEQLVDPGKHNGKVAKYASDICSGEQISLGNYVRGRHTFSRETHVHHCNTGFNVVYVHTQYVTACSVCVCIC